MAAKRIGAALLAIALIIGAVVLRHHLDDTDSAPTTIEAVAPGAAPLTLTCVSDFDAICRAVASVDSSITVVVQPYATTLAAVNGGTPPQLWLTVQPLQSASTLAESTSIAESTMIVVSTKPTAPSVAPFTATCAAATATWRCVGDLAGGSGAAGHLDPRTTVVGLAAMGALAGGYLTDAKADLDSIPAALPDDLQTWLSAIESGMDQKTLFASASATSTIGSRPSAVKLAITSQVDFTRFALTKQASLDVTTPTPVAKERVVLAHAAATPIPSALVAALTKAFSDQGWDAPSTAANQMPTNAQVFTSLPQLGGLP